MGKQRKMPLELGKRERQIFESVTLLRAASVSEVRERLADPPSYSAVRATLNLLVEKGWLKVSQQKHKGIYRPAAGIVKTRRNAAERMLSTFFGGSATDAVAALLDVSSASLNEQQLSEMMGMIEKARREIPK